MEPEDSDLDIDGALPGDPKPGTALARIRSVSLALSDAARRRRLSTRRGNRLSAGGFETVAAPESFVFWRSAASWRSS